MPPKKTMPMKGKMPPKAMGHKGMPMMEGMPMRNPPLGKRGLPAQASDTARAATSKPKPTNSRGKR